MAPGNRKKARAEWIKASERGRPLVLWLDTAWVIHILYWRAWFESWFCSGFQIPPNVYPGRKQAMDLVVRSLPFMRETWMEFPALSLSLSNKQIKMIFCTMSSLETIVTALPFPPCNPPDHQLTRSLLIKFTNNINTVLGNQHKLSTVFQSGK